MWGHLKQKFKLTCYYLVGYKIFLIPAAPLFSKYKIQ